MAQGGKIPGAVPVSGSPQRPGWVCPEDIAVGTGVPVSSWVWNHFSHSLLCIFIIAKLNRNFGKKNLNSSQNVGVPRIGEDVAI